jgi:plasmid maintenance system antidote protein VapI
MAKSSSEISDLQAGELVAKLGLSRSYAFELLKRVKTPSLEVAVRIEQEFGVPAAAWMTNQEKAA